MRLEDPYYVKNPQPVKGFKSFNFDLSCRPNGNIVRYKVGKEYALKGLPILCQQGFHFCMELPDVFTWYGWSFDTRVCEVEATGIRVESADGKKICTNRIRIVRELSPGEIVGSLDTNDLVVKVGLSDVKVSIDAFLLDRTRYILWISRERNRYVRERDLPYLKERAEEWTRALESSAVKEVWK